MSIFQVAVTVINIVAVIVAPIVAVIIAQSLHEKSERRKDKMYIFRVLMTSRIYGWTVDSVHALNSIDIIFSDDENVRLAWKDLNDKYHVSNPDQNHLYKIQNAQYKLLETMAVSLGYKDKITWETIQNPYVPSGLVQQIETQKTNQAIYGEVLSNMRNIMPTTDKD